MNKLKILTFALSLLLACCIAVVELPATAAVPSTLSYQGQLSTSGGVPVNGPVSISFSLYTASSGGPASWTEPAQSVVVTNGQYNVILGNSVPLTATVFAAPMYLGIKVGSDAEMTPRIVLSSSATALRADTADSAASINCAGCVTATQLAPGLAPAGAPGLNALLAMVNEPAGANCAYGGTKVTSGLDLNANNTLDANEVTATRYVCNGTPYAVVPTVPAGCGTQPLSLGTPISISPAGVGGIVYKGDVVNFSVNVIDTNTCASVTIANNYIWTLVSKPLGSTAALSSTTAASPTLVADVAGGTYQLSVQVIDTLGNKSPTAFVSISVSACGAQAPVIGGTTYPTHVYTSSTTQLGSQVASPDNQNNANPGGANFCPPRFAKTLSYQWSISAAPAGGNAQLSSLVSSAPTFSAGTVVGQYVVNVVVTDSAGLSSPPVSMPIAVSLCGTAPLNWPPSNAFSVSVSDPDPLSPFAQVNVGGQVQLTPNANDPNVCAGAPVTQNYQWALVAAPAGSAVKPITDAAGVAQFIPDKVGTYQFQVIATDSLGSAPAPYFVSVTTSTCGANPISVSAQAAGFSAPVGTVVDNPVNVLASASNGIGLVGGSAQSGDNSQPTCPTRFAQEFTYAWSIVNAPPGTTAQLTNVNGSTTTFMSGTVPGYYQIQVVAQGSNGLSSAPSYVFFKLN